MTDVPTEHRFYGDLAVPQRALRHDARRPLIGHARGVPAAQPRVRPPSGRHAHGAAWPQLRRGVRPRRRGLHDQRGDLRQAIETAFVHCRPGGIAVFVTDHIAETFEAASDHGGNDDVDGRGVRYLEWAWDPDPADTWTLTEYAFLLRDADGSVQVVHETHRMGLFSRDVWLQLLASAGFNPDAVVEQTTEDRTPRELFVCHRPRA